MRFAHCIVQVKNERMIWWSVWEQIKWMYHRSVCRN